MPYFGPSLIISVAIIDLPSFSGERWADLEATADEKGANLAGAPELMRGRSRKLRKR
jgi:hypothetical protein